MLKDAEVMSIYIIRGTACQVTVHAESVATQEVAHPARKADGSEANDLSAEGSDN